MPPRALIVEDHPLYRDALASLVGTALDASVLAAGSAEEALRLAADTPELRVIVLDPGLPGASGADAIAALRRARPDAVIVAVSASEDRREAQAALHAGAAAYVSKAVPTEVLAGVLRRALDGALATPEWVMPAAGGTLDEDGAGLLTARQREVLALMEQGLGNKEIGLRLDLAQATVKSHVAAIFRAFGVANRTQAVVAARRLGRP